jgi:hypothetical protein
MRIATTKKSLSLIAAVGLTAVVAVFAHGEIAHQSAVTGCNADAEAVETAVSEFRAEHSSTAATPAMLTKGKVDGKPFLKAWPKGGALYSVSLSSTGQVRVAVPATARAVSYDTANPCASAG